MAEGQVSPQQLSIARALNWLVVFLGNDFPLLGTQKVFPMRYAINATKGGTFVLILILMYYYDNFSTGPYVYLSLHGSYAILWVVKDIVFGDPSWKKQQTIGSTVNTVIILIGYCYAPYHLISTRYSPSSIRICISIFLTLLGSVLMMTSDAQKFYTLKYRKGLITEGLFAYTRNPNYLGEIMLYSGFGILSGSWISYLYLLFIWSFMFWSNMVIKDASLSRYPEWSSYSKQSWMLIPKLGSIFSQPHDESKKMKKPQM